MYIFVGGKNMKNKQRTNKKTIKGILTLGISCLFITLLMAPTVYANSGPLNCIQELRDQEVKTIEQFMEEIEKAIRETKDFEEFKDRVRSIILDEQFGSFEFPVTRLILQIVLNWILRGSNIDGFGILLNKRGASIFDEPKHFVIGFGAHTSMIPQNTENNLRFIKGIKIWRYTDDAKLVKGRTLIIQQNPFEIKQRLKGPQIGMMTGFQGVFLDIESKLTGITYTFFIGNARRARGFDFAFQPLSKK